MSNMASQRVEHPGATVYGKAEASILDLRLRGIAPEFLIMDSESKMLLIDYNDSIRVGPPTYTGPGALRVPCFFQSVQIVEWNGTGPIIRAVGSEKQLLDT